MIDIILPTYNSERYIRQTLLSIINQSFYNWNLLVIDSFSNDKTIDIIKSFKDQRISIHNFKGNVSQARIYGVSLSQSDFIAFIDSDDLWKKNKLELQFNFMKLHNIDFSSTSYEYFKDEKQYPITLKNETITFKSQLIYRDIANSSVMVKKKILRDFYKESDNIFAEDYLNWMMILKNRINCYLLKENLTSIRIHNANRSKNYFKQIKDIFFIYNKKLNFNFFLSLIILIAYLIMNLNKIKLKLLYD